MTIFNYKLNRHALTLVLLSSRKEAERPERIIEMTYRLICSQNFISEQDLHIIDWENGFVCKYEMRDREVRQNS